MRRRESGYTLLELLIALGLATTVMLGVFSVLSSMVRFQVEGARRSTVDSWAIAGVVAMNKEVESADSIAVGAVPSATAQGDGTSANWMVACTNWSTVATNQTTGGRMNATDACPIPGSPGCVVVYAYCYDATAPGFLHRYMNNSSGNVSCSLAGFNATTCSDGNASRSSIIATNVSQLGGANVFMRENASNGVRVRFQVGVQSTGVLAPGAGNPQVVNPQFLQFDMRVVPSRSYLTSAD